MFIYTLHLFIFQTDNPYNCSCESQSTWQWVKDHQKIMHSTERFIECDAPFSLRGRPFATVTPEEFCPLITTVGVDDIQRYSITVSWQNRDHSELDGFEIFYQAIDGGVDDVSHYNSYVACIELVPKSIPSQFEQNIERKFDIFRRLCRPILCSSDVDRLY